MLTNTKSNIKNNQRSKDLNNAVNVSFKQAMKVLDIRRSQFVFLVDYVCKEKTYG
jgi:hypothetical protein